MLKLIENTHVTYCETFTCRKRTDYIVNSEGAPLQLGKNLCNECAKSLYESMKEVFEPKEAAAEKPANKKKKEDK